MITLKKVKNEIKRYYIFLGFTFVSFLLIILIASITHKENIFKVFLEMFLVPCHLLQLLAIMSVPYAIFCIYLLIKYLVRKFIDSTKFRISVILLLLFSPIILLFLSYNYSKKPFDLFLNDILVEISTPNYPKSNSRISAQSNINGNCIEGEYRRKYIPKHYAVFSFYVDNILLLGDNLNCTVKNYTKYDYNFILEQQHGEEWKKLNIEIHQIEMLPDTARFHAFQFKKNESSIKTFREPDCVLFGKVWSTKKVTTYQLEQVWSQDYHFAGTKQVLIFKTKDLDIGRYRVCAEIANIDTLFDEFDIVKKRNVKWIFSERNMLNPDFIKIGITNLDKSSFFYSVYDNKAILGAIGYKIENGKVMNTSVLFEGFIDVPVREAAVRGGETVYLNSINPLSSLSFNFNGEWVNSSYKYEREKFINDFMQYWGDSLSISFFLNTRSLRGSKYKDQTLKSHRVRLSTKKIISLWKINSQ